MAKRTPPNDERVHITYQLQKRTCGKKCCWNSEEKGHGPYWYAYWRFKGRVYSGYIGTKDPRQTDARIVNSNLEKKDK